MDGRKSAVWKYFSKVSTESAKCSKCSTILKCKGGSTSTLGNHLKFKHKIEFRKTEEENESAANFKKAKLSCTTATNITLDSFLKRESLGELLAKCAAHDGFSIHGITNSIAIKEFVSKRNYAMPRSETTVRDLIVAFSMEKKMELRDLFSKLRELGQKFSITTDEWTNIRAKRFLCITIHTNEQKYSLGLIRVEGSCDALKIETLIREKLLEFHLSLKRDIVASTHDGASVMQKYGKLTGIESQLCYNHAIHLAIMDAFYNKTVNAKLICEEDENASENDDDGTDDNDDLNHSLDIVVLHDDANEYLFEENLNDVLKKSRKIIKHFKKSAVKNSILQKYVIQQEGKELSLLLDCKTRWNSLIPMLERLLKLKNCVKEALKDTGREDLYHKDVFVIAQNIIDVLKPIELAVNELSKDNVTLLASEGILNFVFDKLQSINSNLSIKMYESLKKRILERRNSTLVSLHKYLQSGSLPTKSNQLNVLSYATKASTISLAKDMTTRLFMEVDSAESHQPVNKTDYYVSKPSTSCSKGLVEEMQASISSFLKDYATEVDVDNAKEFKLFESTGTRAKNLQKLLDALNTIQPTSTSSERIFSVASNFCTKIRSAMKFETLDALVFLKYYLLKKF